MIPLLALETIDILGRALHRRCIQSECVLRPFAHRSVDVAHREPARQHLDRQVLNPKLMQRLCDELSADKIDAPPPAIEASTAAERWQASPHRTGWQPPAARFGFGQQLSVYSPARSGLAGASVGYPASPKSGTDKTDRTLPRLVLSVLSVRSWSGFEFSSCFRS